MAWQDVIPSHITTVNGGTVLGSLDRRPAVELSPAAEASLVQTGTGTAIKRIGLKGTFLAREILVVGTDQSWEIVVEANGASSYILVDKSAHYQRPQVLSLDDLFIDTGAGELLSSFRVTLRLAGPGLSNKFYILPCMVLDGVVIDETVTDIAFENRFPYPNQTSVPSALPTWEFDYANYDTVSVPSADLVITVNSVVIYTGGGDVFGTTVISAATARRNRVVITPSGAGPWNTPGVNGLQTIVIAGPGGISGTWSWNQALEVPPVIGRAIALGGSLIEVEFTADMDGGEDVLDPGAYDLFPNVTPAFPPEVTAVTRVNAMTYRLTLDDNITFRVPYTLTVSKTMTDATGELFADGLRSYVVGALEFIRDNRVFDVFEMFPRFNRCNDPDNELLHLSRVIQDIFGQILHRIDSFPSVLDPRTAPLATVCDMLSDFGNDNMFTFDMTEAEKRQLVLEIARFQEQVGTEPGMEDAIRFFLGLDVEIVTRADSISWTLGISLLGDGTILAPPPLSDRWLTIWVKLPAGVLITDLSAQDASRAAAVVRVMSGANAKYGGIIEF